MNQPPIPPIPELQGQSCPNCGQSVAANAPRCPNCGATLRASSSPSVWKILLACALGMVALGLGAMGACFMLFGTISLTSGDLTLGFTGLLLAGGAALCIWGAIRLLKR